MTSAKFSRFWTPSPLVRILSIEITQPPPPIVRNRPPPFRPLTADVICEWPHTVVPPLSPFFSSSTQWHQLREGVMKKKVTARPRVLWNLPVKTSNGCRTRYRTAATWRRGCSHRADAMPNGSDSGSEAPPIPWKSKSGLPFPGIAAFWNIRE